MRPIVPLLAAAVLAAGCLDLEGGGAAPCPANITPPAGEGRAVEVQVANSMEGPTCARVHFDGVLVAARELQGEHPALHNSPVPLASFEWGAAEVRLRVDDSLTGRVHEETVRLNPGKTWVAVWIGETGVTVRTFDEPPTYA